MVLPNDFEIDAGYGVIYFDTEGGNKIALKSTIERGDEDIVEICVDDDNFMIQFSKGSSSFYDNPNRKKTATSMEK